jgi:hypothetical protein
MKIAGDGETDNCNGQRGNTPSEPYQFIGTEGNEDNEGTFGSSLASFPSVEVSA